ncbi:UBA domain-containing protein 7 [Teratosphaeria destructans]|uniref:UBA domain-containing protein 7 n=1 Tax=Teratosphaeria destructans TaxID=418781 RepID=A0A9W7VZM5_9PEZI|nr:UBA domain-containing protein 7 [Teratosphaeria destructans]
MDDLLGEDWQAPSKSAPTAPLNPTSSSYNNFRISPQPSSSGVASPANLSRPTSTVNGSAKSTNDSFSHLFASKAQQKPSANLSIQERQKQLIEEKRRQQQEQSALWDNLGSGRATPEPRGRSPAQPQVLAQDDDDDVLAAFNKAAQAPVNKASHFPPPASAGASGRSTPAITQPSQPVAASNGGFDDDDPFGLGAAPQNSNGHATAPASTINDDDILGDLGKPVSERPAQKVPVSAQHEADEVFEQMQASAKSGHEPEDQALAELIDMGFPEDTAKIALTENGGDVEGAVGWLLQQAHEESKQKARTESGQNGRRSPAAPSRSPHRRQRGEQDSNGMPAWMREERSGSATRRQDSRSPANGEKDAAQMAQEFGSKLFKGANSLWKASQKQMAKTVAEFQQERDPAHPKWMQDPAEPSRTSSQRRAPQRRIETTDEAAMLGAPRERPQKSSRPAAMPADVQSRERTPVETALPSRPTMQPKLMQQQAPQQDKRPATKLSRQEVEDQSAQAYISPARRKKTTPQPQPTPEAEVDLFSPAPVLPTKSAPVPSSLRPPPAPTSVRPSAPLRNIPSASPAALATSARHRKAGGEAFKRGDFDAAHQSYTAALTPLPASHPITIIVLSNRSLTALKTGDAKTAVSDADKALEIIGVSQGAGESIDLGAGEGSKDMKEFYGKALMRKAEALEHMEKWVDAGNVWRQAISAGVGGAISIRGRDRCEKAAAPKAAAPKSVSGTVPAPRKAAPPAKSLGNSMQRPTITSASEAQAVKKLREANAAAERADDEKFALADQVDARLTAWKGGKADNLRALLQSLDSVLWESAGWKKVGMSDLVMPNKVKIVYMKAIAKVHPDKVCFFFHSKGKIVVSRDADVDRGQIPQDATTEQRMISGAVFSTLNEAWDKFRKDNHL